jgi:glycosyltransferase involved in cell wall biosynthesis
MKAPLYQIIDVYLHKELAMPVVKASQHGYYLVFWWHNTALGHIFIEQGTSLYVPEYNHKLIAAIEPALEYYANPQQAPWQHWIENHDFDSWSVWMHSVFSLWEPASFPEEVPVSLVICTYNRANMLERCLASLYTLPCQPAEIIVVDNAPGSGTLKNMVQQFDRAVYVAEPRQGLDIARNAGIAQAAYPIVAFTDDDVKLHPLCIYRIWQSFEQPEVMAVTGLVLPAELDTEAQCIFEKYWSFNRGYKDHYFTGSFLTNSLAKGPPVWKIGAGANMAFRKEVFNKAGNFNELLDAGAAGCSGDSEMWYRILKQGHTIHYNPRAIVFHEHRKEMEALKQQIFNYMRGHAAAALIQQRQHQKAGYRRYLAKLLLKKYSVSVIKGFPDYKYRYKTLWAQISGVVSGLLYYAKHRNKAVPTHIKP